MIHAKKSLLPVRDGFLLIELLIAMALVGFFTALITIAFALIITTHKKTEGYHTAFHRMQSAIILFQRQGVVPQEKSLTYSRKELAQPQPIPWIKNYRQGGIQVFELRCTDSTLQSGTITMRGVKG